MQIIHSGGSIGSNGPSNVSFKSIVIPASITKIGAEAFSNQGSLETITFSGTSSLTHIGDGAFAIYGPSSLEVTIPDSVTHIGDLAFANALPMNIPANLVSIGAGAFQYHKLKTITIPDSLAYMGTNAFSGYTSDSGTFKTINVSPNNQHFSVRDGVLYNKDETVLFESFFGDGTIPSTVTRIEDRAFFFRSFSTIIIPDSVTSIGDLIFSGTELREITIGAGLDLFGQKSSSNSWISFSHYYTDVYNKQAGTYIYNAANYTWTKKE